MKKSLLLLVTSWVFAITTVAQERQVTIANGHQDGRKTDVSELKKAINERHGNSVQRTTSSGGRWYFYGDYLDTIYTLASLGTEASVEFLDPWANMPVSSGYDTFDYVKFIDTGGQYIIMASVGTILNPSDSAFNDQYLYTGQMKVTASTPYTVDSVLLAGVYGYNSEDTNVVDTIRLTFVYGALSGSSTSFLSGTLPSGGFYGTADFLTLPYDSITNISQPGYTIPASHVQDIILNNHSITTGGGVWCNGINYADLAGPAWGDTTSGGSFIVQVPLTIPLTSIPGSNGVGVTESFFSGQPGPIALPGDTLANFNTGRYKVNCYGPYDYFACNPAFFSDPLFPPYSGADSSAYAYIPYTSVNHNLNTGLYKQLPNYENGWENIYIPTWGWATGGGASVRQYPYINLHLACSSCGLVTFYHHATGVNNVANNGNTIDAYPNPANNSLNIAFDLPFAAPVTITLTNMVGEAMDSQDMGSVAKGNAVFNTANFAEGIYIYTISVNGARSTGYVSIVH